MKDRIPSPGKEGRVKITPENGGTPFYAQVEMADEPLETGTPLGKASLLGTDTEIALWGNAADRTVDDALNHLSAAALIKSTTVDVPAGDVWKWGALPASGTWNAFTAGKGVFVAIAQGTNILVTSPDGVNWTQRTMPSSQNWINVVYGGETFVAIAQGTNICATSPDGITWTQRTMPSSQNWRCLAYANGLFMALPSGITTVYATSPDGVNWTQRTMPASGNWTHLSAGNNIFFAYNSNQGTTLYTSSTGTSWTTLSLPSIGQFRGLFFGGGLFVMSGLSGIATSSNGTDWTVRTSPVAFSGNTYGAFGNGLFVIGVDSTSSNVVISKDGINWEGRSAPSYIRGLAFNNGRFVGVGIGGAYAYSNKITTTSLSATNVHGNMIGEYTRVEFTSYIGTGAYGAGAPNKVTLNFNPKLFRVIPSDGGNAQMIFHFPEQGAGYVSRGYLNLPGNRVVAFLADGEVSWYTTDNSSIDGPRDQGNQASTTYLCCAIG